MTEYSPRFWIKTHAPNQYASDNYSQTHPLSQYQREIARGVMRAVGVVYGDLYAVIRPLPDGVAPPATIKDGVKDGYYAVFETKEAAIAYAVLT